ncbi:MAG: DUF1080 domain-containing protein [Gemmataceae bacterium]
MKHSVLALAVLMVPLFSLIGESPRPTALTAEEVRDGWLSLFDGESTFGWIIEGEARIEKGTLVLGGKKVTTARPSLILAAFRLCAQLDVVGPGEVEVQTGPGQQKLRARIGHAFDLQTTYSVNLGPVFQVRIPADTQVRLHNLRVQPTRLVSLFNGKDLTGWKIFRGNPKQEKSRWTVTPEGWLNVKDGPGDLQTEKQFDDFVLQLECRSNGKHLNSGLFFRCQPDRYQQGYEAQIRNQLSSKGAEKYTVEDYDPRTNKLVGKKTIESPAFDFGTGAIYRRVPARKLNARDGEWFTMTVVTRGRHIATWVNGLQVVDWTDNRPAADNGRNGYRAAAGALSIQGHDPTTDLSFRNLRITAIPR